MLEAERRHDPVLFLHPPRRTRKAYLGTTRQSLEAPLGCRPGKPLSHSSHGCLPHLPCGRPSRPYLRGGGRGITTASHRAPCVYGSEIGTTSRSVSRARSRP